MKKIVLWTTAAICAAVGLYDTTLFFGLGKGVGGAFWCTCSIIGLAAASAFVGILNGAQTRHCVYFAAAASAGCATMADGFIVSAHRPVDIIGVVGLAFWLLVFVLSAVICSLQAADLHGLKWRWAFPPYVIEAVVIATALRTGTYGASIGIAVVGIAAIVALGLLGRTRAALATD
jgi:hypothetical protein